MMRLVLFILLTATLAEAQNPPPAQTAAPILPKELTLSQALDIALTNNTNIREAQAKFDQIEGQKQSSKSVLLPQLTFDAHQALMTVNLQGSESTRRTHTVCRDRSDRWMPDSTSPWTF
jgi:Outer membrane protein